MTPLAHQHLIVRADILRCPGPEDCDQVAGWLRQLITHIGMKILDGPFVRYCNVPGNRGLTAVVIIETSHVALHIWDEHSPGLLQLDVYSCAPFQPAQIFSAVDQQFGTRHMHYKFLDRENDLEELTEGELGEITNPERDWQL